MVFSRGPFRRAVRHREKALAMRSAQWVACLMGYFIGFCSAIVLLGLMRDLADWWRGR
jgi:hypothetical protein